MDAKDNPNKINDKFNLVGGFNPLKKY